MIIKCLFLFSDCPGTYTVVRGGAASHYIHSKPNIKGCPLGRLSKGSIIEAIEEVRGRRWKEKEGEKEREGRKREGGKDCIMYVSCII